MKNHRKFIDHCVQSAIHSRCELSTSHDWSDSPEIHRQTCHSRFGQCQTIPHNVMASKFAREFARALTQHSVPSGGLIRLQAISVFRPFETVEPNQAEIVFNGMICKKPLEHVVLQARETWLDFYQVALFEQDSMNLPGFTTTHQLFRTLLANASGSVEKFRVEVLAYKVDAGLGAFERLEVRVTHVQQRFDLFSTAPKKTPSAVKVSLPFGFTMPKRKRKPRKDVAAKAKAKQKARPQPSSEVKIANVKIHSSESSSSSDCSDSDSESDSPDSPSTETDSSSNSDSDCDPVLEGIANPNAAVRGGSEHVAPPTSSARTETVQVAQAVDELNADREMKAEMANQRRTGSSFFPQKIGFSHEVSLAPSARSVCYHCASKIDKGALRMVYFFSLQRPSRYMHLNCVLPFVEGNEGQRKDQAILALLAISGNANADESVKRQIEVVLSHVTALGQNHQAM